MIKSNLEEERVYVTLQHGVQHREKPEQELKAGTLWQELKQRPHRKAVYWLALRGLLNRFFLKIEPSTSCSGVTAHTQLAWPPTSVSNKGNAWWTFPQADLVNLN